MRTEDLALQESTHAVWQANSNLPELINHSDRGSQYLSLADTDRLAGLGIAPSVGRVVIIRQRPRRSSRRLQKPS